MQRNIQWEKGGLKIKEKKGLFAVFLTIVTLILLLVIVPILSGKKVNLKEATTGVKYNTNKNFLKSQEIEGLKFENIVCSFNGKVSLISYDVVNEKDNELYLKSYQFDVKNEKGEVLTTVMFDFDRVLKSQERVSMKNETNIDVTSASLMEFHDIKFGEN